MIWSTFFRENDILQGEGYTCILHPAAGAAGISCGSRYPVLFVLSGTLILFIDKSECVVPAGEMVILDRTRAADGFCTPGTIVLQYELPDALTDRFNALNGSHTPFVPITGRLETWVEELLEGRLSGASAADGLVLLLLKYQYRRLRSICPALNSYAEARAIIKQKKPVEHEQ